MNLPILRRIGTSGPDSLGLRITKNYRKEPCINNPLDKRVRTLKQIVQGNLGKSTLGQVSYKIIEGKNPLSINLKWN